ncbi:MAG: hypothetical protein O7G87_17745 [bacterium]|nr:hypothetical protein [bacterium]
MYLNFLKLRWILGGLLALFLAVAPADAVGIDGMGLKVGMDLGRQQTLGFGGTVGGEFDQVWLALGAYTDLGSAFSERFHWVSGVDLVLKDQVQIYSVSWEGWYFFGHAEGTRWYAGAGPGIHILQSNETGRDVKVTVNVPLGFQKRMGKGASWFGEMKIMIADDEADSSLRFSLGVNFGGSP